MAQAPRCFPEAIKKAIKRLRVEEKKVFRLSQQEVRAKCSLIVPIQNSDYRN